MDDDSVPPGQSPLSDAASSGAEPQPSRKKADEELAALRSEVQNLRKELARAQAERDVERKAVQAMFAKLYPDDLKPIDPATLVRRPAGTPDIFEDALAEMERLGYAPL
jgi:hypothetical protein